MSDMDMFNYNFDEAEKPTGMDPVPAGPYTVRIVDTGVSFTNAGDPQVNVQLQIEGGEYDGRMIFDRWFMPNKAKQEAEKYKKSLGFLQDRLEAIYGVTIAGDQKLRPDDLMGRRCIVQVNAKADPQKNPDGTPVIVDGKQQFYPVKNNVTRWLPFQAPAAQQAQAFPTGAPSVPPQPMTAPSAPAAAPTAAPVAAASPQAASPAPSEAPTPAGDAAGTAAFRL